MTEFSDCVVECWPKCNAKFLRRSGRVSAIASLADTLGCSIRTQFAKPSASSGGSHPDGQPLSIM